MHDKQVSEEQEPAQRPRVRHRVHRVVRAVLPGALGGAAAVLVTAALTAPAGAQPRSAPGSARIGATGQAARLDAASGPGTPLPGPTTGDGTVLPGTTPGGTSAAPTTSGAGPASVTRTWLEHALARRLGALRSLKRSVESSRVLSPSARATLESELQTETSGIQSLAASVTAEPATQLRATAVTMVDSYRVYLVMAPKVLIAERTSRQAAIETRVRSAEPVISARISAAGAAGRTVSAAVTADATLTSAASSATASTGSIDVNALLALTPSGYPADASVIRADRAALGSARSALVTVRHEVRSIRASLGNTST